MMSNDAFPRPCLAFINGEVENVVLHGFFAGVKTTNEQGFINTVICAVVENKGGEFLTIPAAAIKARDNLDTFMCQKNQRYIDFF